jgi:hypothetical protein
MAKKTTRILNIAPSPSGGYLLKATVETNDHSRHQVLLADNMQRVVAEATAEAFQRALFAFNGVWFDVHHQTEEATSERPAEAKAAMPTL